MSLNPAAPGPDRYLSAAFLSCMLLFLLLAVLGTGWLACSAGAFTVVLGLWLSARLRARSRFGAFAVALLTITSAVLLCLPLWPHVGFRYQDGRLVTERHHHYLWNSGHVH